MQIETWGAVGALAVALVLAGCEKPQLRSERSVEAEESTVDAGTTPRAEPSAEPSVAETRQPRTPASSPAPKAEPKKGVDPAVRAREIAHHQAKIDAQLAGIRSLESDLSRHSLQLNALRGELSSARARQSAQRSGGIVIERIDGRSTRVDHAKVAAELEARVRAEEQIVDQLTRSLEEARGQHRELESEFDRLWQE